MKKMMVICLGCLGLAWPYLMSAADLYTECEGECSNTEICADDSRSFFIGAEWLYWKGTQDNLGFSTISSAVVAGDSATVSSSLIEQKFKFNSGFRASIGYQPQCDCWEAGLCYTYLPSHSRASRSIEAPNQFITVYHDNIGVFKLLENLPFDSMNSKWNLNLYYIDLDIGYSLLTRHG